MKVQISDKEQSRIKTAKAYFEGQGCTVEVTNLEIGDYIFDDGQDQCVFEFKTIQDFISSINDNRVFNEALNQAENYNHHFVVIQGSDVERAKQIALSRNYREVTYFQYLGAIASLNRYTTVIESYSPLINESYYRMLITAKKALSQKPIVKKFPRKNKNPAFNYLCYCVYGLNHKRAKQITDKYELKTLEDLLYLDHNKLTAINGIGDKLADKILTTINNDTYES